LKSRVVGVVRKNDKVIVVKLVFEKKVLNIISAYASQVGCEKWTRKCFDERWMR